MGAIAILAQEDQPGFTDNAVLDEFTVPFGEWVEQMVRWIDQNMQSVLSKIEWPFNKLFTTFVDGPNHHPFWEITDMPWWAIVLITFLIGSFVRNVRVGVGTASALAVCGLLGVEYWDEVSVTIGMILVSVVLCALVGIPIGVACGRVDSVWASVRPALDAMQVVHSFVYMLPVIFFFGIGKTSATMVTMVFAIPPLIRLTNLGIRSVPEDVVEASRSYGAPEARVLLDVQLPLARPAIMTGLNQTLLLSISMLGIAAIMGAGGLGQLVFRGVQNLDINLSASAGLSLFLVAVVLDRISQTQDDDGASLGKRIRAAWSHRSDPEELMALTQDGADEQTSTSGGYAPLTSSEQLGSKVALGAGALMFISTFLTWSSDGGVVSGYARAADVDLSGQSFSGWNAEGGSWFAIFVAIAGLFIVGSALWTLRSPSDGTGKIGPDGSMIAAIAALGSALAFLVASPTNGSPASIGLGVWIAVIASVAAVVGSVLWIKDAPYSARHPLKANVSYGKLVVGALLAGSIIIAGFSGWTFDRRANSVISEDLQAQLDALVQESRDDPSTATINASQIAALTASAQRNPVVIDGFTSRGAGLGWLSLVLGITGAGLMVGAAGVLGNDESRKWRYSVAVTGVGYAMMAVGGAWIISILRVADNALVSGAGAFLVTLAGFILTTTGRTTISEFQRSQIFEDYVADGVSAAAVVSPDPVAAPA